MRFLSICAVTAACTAAPAVASNFDLPPVGCIVEHSDCIPAGDLAELVHSGFAPTTKSGKTTMTVIGQVVQRCRASHGWAKQREDAALHYFAAHVLREEALSNAKRFGMTDGVLIGYVAGLSPEMRSGYAAGKVTPEMNRSGFAHLQAAKMVAAGMASADVQALGQAFNSGVYAVIAQQDAEKAYGR